MAVAIRDKTTSTQQLAVASDGSITATIKGNGTPPSRSMDYWYLDQVATTQATELLMTINESVNGAASGTFTTRVVTSGKTMRITSMSLTVENGGSTPVLSRVYVAIRFNTAGAVTASSQIVYRVGVSVAATAKSITNYFADFPDGMEFVGDGTKQIGITTLCPEWVTTTQIPKISLSMSVYEY